MTGEKISILPQNPEVLASPLADVIPETFSQQAYDIVVAHKPVSAEAQSFEAMARVLVVESSAGWRRYYDELGTEAGHEVVGVPSVPEALNELRDGAFDLVITSKQDGYWTSVHEAAGEQGTRTVIVSGEVIPTLFGGYAKEGAEEAGITYLNKADDNLAANLQELFARLNAEDTGEGDVTEHQPYTEFVSDLMNRRFPLPSGSRPDSKEKQARQEIDYSEPFRMRITRDIRDPKDYGPEGDLSGQFGLCLGRFNEETFKPDENGIPILQTDSGEKIWGDEAWWDDDPDAHTHIPFEVQQAALDAYIAGLRVKIGIDKPSSQS